MDALVGDGALAFAFGGTGGSTNAVTFIGNKVQFFTTTEEGPLCGIQVGSTTYGTCSGYRAWDVEEWKSATYLIRQMWVAEHGEHNVISGFVVNIAGTVLKVGSSNGCLALINSAGLLFDFGGIGSGTMIDNLVLGIYSPKS
jgi:hypothetical protein